MYGNRIYFLGGSLPWEVGNTFSILKNLYLRDAMAGECLEKIETKSTENLKLPV